MCLRYQDPSYRNPHRNQYFREPDPSFIKHLKENIKRDSTGPGAAPGAAPLVILCRDVTLPDEFLEKYKNG